MQGLPTLYPQLRRPSVGSKLELATPSREVAMGTRHCNYFAVHNGSCLPGKARVSGRLARSAGRTTTASCSHAFRAKSVARGGTHLNNSPIVTKPSLFESASPRKASHNASTRNPCGTFESSICPLVDCVSEHPSSQALCLGKSLRTAPPAWHASIVTSDGQGNRARLSIRTFASITFARSLSSRNRPSSVVPCVLA